MKLLIVDDDCLVTGALKMILEANSDFQVCACGNNGEEAVSLYQTYRPDILLMDIRMKPMDGLQASEQILSQFPDAKILLLTTFLDDEYIIRALKLGAKGYLLKQDYQNLIPAINAVYAGQTVFGNEIISKLPSLLEKNDTPFSYEQYHISKREAEIIRLVANGLNNKEISETLFLSEGTIRNYLSAILEKLDLRNRTQIAIFYYQHKYEV